MTVWVPRPHPRTLGDLLHNAWCWLQRVAA